MSARRYAKSQKLTADERARLESIASSPEQPAALKRRAKIILWTEHGLSDREIARRVQVSHPIVGLWRRRFQTARLAGLWDEPRPGRPRIHDEKRVARLVSIARNAKPRVGERWSVRTLGEATRMSKTTVWRYLRLHGAEPHRDKRVTYSEQSECLPSPSHTHNEKGN